MNTLRDVPSGDRTHDLAPLATAGAALRCDSPRADDAPRDAQATPDRVPEASNGPRTVPTNRATAKVLGLLIRDAERAA